MQHGDGDATPMWTIKLINLKCGKSKYKVYKTMKSHRWDETLQSVKASPIPSHNVAKWMCVREKWWQSLSVIPCKIGCEVTDGNDLSSVCSAV